MNSAAPHNLSLFARWQVIVLLMGYAALAHFNRVGISVAGTEVFISKSKDGISETQMGAVYTTFLIFYTMAMLPAGWLIDRIGAARALTLLGMGMGTLVALTGSLGPLENSPTVLWIGLLVIRGMAGIGNSPLHPGAAHVVSDVAPASGRATANGMVTAGALLGIACCYPVFGWLIDHLKWPGAFAVSGLALVSYGLLWKWLASPLLPVPQAADAVDAAGHGGPDAATKESMDSASWALLSHANLWLLTLSYAAFGYFQYLFMYWMEHYFHKVLHVADADSRSAAFYIMLAQGAGMAAGGMSTDAVCGLLGAARGRRAIVFSGMGFSALFGLIAVLQRDPFTVALCLAVSMAFLGICEGVFWTTATDIGGRARGFSGAFMNTGGNVGGLLSPLLTPVMAEQIGWPKAIAVACAISLVGGMVWFWIKPRPTTIS